MRKKLLIVVAATAFLLGSMSTTTFADNEGLRAGIKEAKGTLKANVESFKAKKGTVVNAISEKKAELGFVKIDKTPFEAQLQALKTLKSEIAAIRTEIAVAKSANDKEKLALLKAQLKEKIAQLETLLQALAPLKEQIKANKDERQLIKPLLEQIKAMKAERLDIHEQNKAIRSEIKSLIEQLKAAKEAKNTDEMANIAAQIIEKLNLLNNNFTRLNTLKSNAVETIKNWTPGQ